ncbi:hypothetical protein FHX74_003509 [Friedmanniella endophytica]|uniref:VanZ like family protein n=1 Tax=Microlunatus kandeliicorticis TaxID=1759536 RepID=A0A7W3P7C3_9ACTN|nr:hypothetical protein [Microlunatus kandeliicorticis]MBA8795868.1 hypothetical protein [Microlunatus kandeliicorticis]
MTSVRALPVAAVAVKIALGVLLVLAVAAPDLVGNKARAGTARLVAYPVGVLVLPLGWLLLTAVRRARHRPGPAFPWPADLLTSLPWLLDTIGNRFGLFERVSWWDELMHALNWLLLTAGVLALWRTARRATAGVVVVVALGFGCPAALVWELMEWASFNRYSSLPAAVYADTLGDLVMGTLGSLLAALGWLAVRARVRGHKSLAPMV